MVVSSLGGGPEIPLEPARNNRAQLIPPNCALGKRKPPLSTGTPFITRGAKSNVREGGSHERIDSFNIAFWGGGRRGVVLRAVPTGRVKHALRKMAGMRIERHDSEFVAQSDGFRVNQNLFVVKYRRETVGRTFCPLPRQYFFVFASLNRFTVGLHHDVLFSPQLLRPSHHLIHHLGIPIDAMSHHLPNQLHRQSTNHIVSIPLQPQFNELINMNTHTHVLSLFLSLSCITIHLHLSISLSYVISSNPTCPIAITTILSRNNCLRLNSTMIGSISRFTSKGVRPLKQRQSMDTK